MTGITAERVGIQRSGISKVQAAHILSDIFFKKDFKEKRERHVYSIDLQNKRFLYREDPGL